MSKKKQCRARKPPPQAVARESPEVPRNEQQFALIGELLLDVEWGFRLLRAKPRRTVRIDVEAWARLYGLDGNPLSPIKVGPLFDPEHAKTADLRRPLILATLVVNREEVQLICDGSHRLARGFAEGRVSLPAWVLTAAETDAITVSHPGSNRRPRP